MLRRGGEAMITKTNDRVSQGSARFGVVLTRTASILLALAIALGAPLLLASDVPMQADVTPSPEGAGLEIISPKDGDTVTSPVVVQFGLAGMGVAPAGTVAGAEPLRIPAGTQSGEVFVLRGLGVPHLRSSGRGDLLVHAQVVTPKNLTDRQTELLAELAESLGASGSARTRSVPGNCCSPASVGTRCSPQ